jgi:hypothetical protein
LTRADRDLAAAIRAELASIDPARACDRAAEWAGLGPGFATREPAVARLALRLGRDAAGEAGQDEGRRRRHPRVGHDETDEAFDWERAADHCRLAWLRGRFLARGSLSLAGARTHLEFVVEPEAAPVLAARLAAMQLPASWRMRRGRGVVTWKSADAVGTFLRRVGAGGALLELEARQVSRALRGELNRVLNAESANLLRAVSAAGRQLEAIDRLEADGRLGEQSYSVRLVAAGRRETPESTLAELAERLGLHRSAVQRALERLERLAMHDDQRAGPRPGRTHRRGGPAGGEPAGRAGLERRPSVAEHGQGRALA